MLALRDHDTTFSLSCSLKSEGPTYGSNTLREHDTAFLLSLKSEGTTKFSLSAYRSWFFSFGRGLVLFEPFGKALMPCTGENSTLISGLPLSRGPIIRTLLIETILRGVHIRKWSSLMKCKNREPVELDLTIFCPYA